MIDPAILYALLGANALLFAFSALEKHQDRRAFHQLIRDYKLVPDALVPIAGHLLFGLELVAATLLITQLYKVGVVIGIGLLILYAIAIQVNLVRGRRHIDCGCLGSTGEGISYWHIARNFLLLSVLAVSFLPVIPRDLVWLDFIAIVASVLAASMVYVTFSSLLVNHLNQRMWWSE